MFVYIIILLIGLNNTKCFMKTFCWEGPGPANIHPVLGGAFLNLRFFPFYNCVLHIIAPPLNYSPHGSILFRPPVCFTPPVTNYTLLYSTLLCKKIARALGGGKYNSTKPGGIWRNRKYPPSLMHVYRHWEEGEEAMRVSLR